ncbi:helix-turn-helix domain-containing protein [Paenibacillus sp. VCA1]|uniref:helix-turn-helix domain-containing protein n=1 Tax=Paenibacillus sp. VCA1 TaxID=3039148 RepID=UPI002872710E|nr:helix-turn-helix domain-containing protein [Paenibacillus sp. VCA1]MDR9854752.1 helix-turn-helix domain-containing protein [Paenibacillus sp. VCA1]
MNASSERATLVLRFFVPYVLILLGALLSGWFAYHKTSSLLETETMKSNTAALGQIREALDGRFAEVETIAQQMASESKIQSFQFVKAPFEQTNPFRLWDLEKSLFDYRMTNHFIVDYFIAYKNSGMFISPRKVYNGSQFYGLQLRYEGKSYEQWYKELFSRYYYKTYQPGMPVLYEGKPYSVVSYMQSFGAKDGGGVISVLIDNKQIQEMLRHIDSEQGGFAYVADQNGNLISYVGMDPTTANMKALPVKEGFSQFRWNGKKMLITQTTSRYNGWTYVSAQPEAVVLAKANYIKELTLTVFMLAMGAGLVFAALLAYRSSRPVFKMLQLLPLKPAGSKKRPLGNVMDDIRSSVSALVESHGELSSRLEAQVPMLRNVFFERLLQGGFTSMDEVEAAMEHARIELKGHYFAAAAIQIRGYHAPYNEEMLTELDIVKLNVRDRIGTIGADQQALAQVHDLGENKLALLFHGEGAAPDAFMNGLQRQISQLGDHWKQASHSGLWIAVGTCQTRLTEVYRSYGEAEFLLVHAAWSERQPVLFYDEAEVPPPVYFYPSDVEQRLIQLVRSGNKPETARLIAQIREENDGGRPLPVVAQKLLAQELCGTLMKCCELSPASEDMLSEEMKVVLEVSDSELPPDEAVHKLFQALMQLCRKHEERKRSHNDSLTSKLMSYIDNHFSDPDISLAMLAKEARNSEAYVSYFFKEQTGMNFSDYLEHVRMEEAKRLLIGSALPVSDIAVRTGYLSLNSFSRAFKRANGVSATEYRKVHQPREA